MPAAEVADPPPPTKDTINPSLKALFDVNIPEPETEPETPPVKPPIVPEAPPAAPVDDKKPDTNAKLDELKIRLAPDFAAKEAAPVIPPAEPDADLVELDQAIKDAPSEKARVDLKKFRDRLSTLAHEVTTLKAKPAPPPEDTETKTLLDTVTKERDDLLARVERTDLMSSPKFQREHLMPRQKSFEQLTGIVKESGGDPAALQHAISLTGKQRIEALDEIRGDINSDMMKGRFDRLVEDIDSRTTDINEKLRNAKQAAEEMKRDETVQTHEQRMQTQKKLEGLLGSAFLDLEENVGLAVLRKTGKPEFQWHDENVDKINALAKEIYLNATPEKAAYASVAAAAFDTVHDWWKSERAARLAVEAENRELKGADPTITPDRKGVTVEAEGTDADSILSRLRAGHYKK